ncbi:MAG: multidrug efflux pump subunit AcrB, partial [Neolewinella sp.]
MKLPDYALSHRVVVIVSVLVLCLWGALSFQASPRRETPEFTIRIAVISTAWDGATVETIEQLVAEPLEQAVFSIDEVDRVDTTVTTGLSVIRVVIDDRVPAHKVENLWDEVRAAVSTVRLPSNEGCGPAVVNSNFGDTAIWMLSVYQDQSQPEENRYSSRQIEVFADQLRDQFKLLPDVATAELHGVQNEVIYLETDPRSWSKLALTTDELAMRISQRNIVTSGGTIELPVGRVNIKPSGNYSAVDQINRLVIARDAAGSPVYLEDLGIRARRGYEEPTRELDRYTNASPDAATEAAETVLIAITMKAGRNVVDLGEQLRTTLDRAHQSMLPSDLKTALIIDTPSKVGQTIGDFVVNLMQSVVIVFLVAFLLIGLRIALIMAAAIPVVMLGSFALMRLIGVELEQMSIAALIIALGMLVDNVIEVCDNTHRLLQDGRPRREAALQGAAQIGFPILIATLTTVAAFVPMIIALEGGGAEYVFSIPAVVTIALSVSWILAMTLTTVLSYWFLRQTTSATPLVWLASQLARLVPKRWLAGRNNSNHPSSDTETAKASISLYQQLAAKAIDFKLLTVGIAVAGFAFALFLLATGRIGSQFFPASVQSKLLVEVYLPDGATIAQTSDKCREVERMILGLQRPDEPARLRDIVTMVGNGGPRIELGASPADPASNYGALLVHTTAPELVDPLITEIREHVLPGVSGARIRPIKYGMGPPVDNPIGVRIVGPGFADLRRMRDIADHVQNVFRASPRTWDVTQNWGNLGMQLQVVVDESKATTSGVSSA